MFVSSDYVRCVAFDPQKSNILASCSDDKTIKIWDITSGSCLSTLTGHSGWVLSVAFSKDGTRLVSGSADKTVKIWSVGSAGTFECESTLTGHSGWVLSVAFSKDGTRLVSGSADKTVEIWSVGSAGTFECESTLTSHWYVPFPCIECLLS
jgi:WD40 repeat protein